MNRTRRIAAVATLTVLAVAGSVAAAARPDRPEPSRPAPPATVSDADDEMDDDMDEPKPTDGMGPDTTGPASFGLCTAWSRNAEQAKKAPPFRSLTAEMCAPVLAARPNGARAERTNGRPSSTSTGLDRADEASNGRRP